MNKNITARNEKLAKEVIKGLESRQMSGYWAADKEEALKEIIAQVRDLIVMLPSNNEDEAAQECMDDLNRECPSAAAFVEDPRAAMLAAYDADVFLSSANAMTQDGVLVNIDGNANRVSAIAQGPHKVLFIVGMNKVCDDLDGAMKRARNVAAPINAQRFDINTPCNKTGKCMNCKSPDTICCQFLITRFERHPGRVHVILVNDALGF